MRIKSFDTTSPLFPLVSFERDKPVCFFAGASIFLHMMRCLLDGEEDGAPVDESKVHTFVSRVRFESDGDEHGICGVLCDDQTFFISADTKKGFSENDTKECISKLCKLRSNTRNYYCLGHKYVKNDDCLSESDGQIKNFKAFLEVVKCETKRGDDRPIYIFDFFERLDGAVDIIPFIDELTSFGRQVFISVNANYPEKKMRHDKVQTVRFAL